MFSQGWLPTEALEARGPGKFSVPESQEGAAGGDPWSTEQAKWLEKDYDQVLIFKGPLILLPSLCKIAIYVHKTPLMSPPP